MDLVGGEEFPRGRQKLAKKLKIKALLVKRTTVNVKGKSSRTGKSSSGKKENRKRKKKSTDDSKRRHRSGSQVSSKRVNASSDEESKSVRKEVQEEDRTRALLDATTYVEDFIDSVELTTDCIARRTSKMLQYAYDRQKIADELHGLLNKVLGEEDDNETDAPSESRDPNYKKFQMMQLLMLSNELGDEARHEAEGIQEFLDDQNHTLKVSKRNLAEAESKLDPSNVSTLTPRKGLRGEKKKMSLNTIGTLSNETSMLDPMLEEPLDAYGSPVASTSSSYDNLQDFLSSDDRFEFGAAKPRTCRLKNPPLYNMNSRGFKKHMELNLQKKMLEQVIAKQKVQLAGPTKKISSGSRKRSVEVKPDPESSSSSETSPSPEPTYCLCDKESFGRMIACDNNLCPIEWYHFRCIGLKTSPKGLWFCPMCRDGQQDVMKPRDVFLKELEEYNKRKEKEF